jgi:predicted DNA-binding transcriptional regulator AlpA
MEKKLLVPITKSDFNDVITSTRSAPKTECTNHLYDPQRLLRLPQVLALIPVSKSCWWQWVRDGKAPQPIHLGDRCTCWRYGDIIALTKGVE